MELRELLTKVHLRAFRPYSNLSWVLDDFDRIKLEIDASSEGRLAQELISQWLRWECLGYEEVAVELLPGYRRLHAEIIGICDDGSTHKLRFDQVPEVLDVKAMLMLGELQILGEQRWVRKLEFLVDKEMTRSRTTFMLSSDQLSFVGGMNSTWRRSQLIAAYKTVDDQDLKQILETARLTFIEFTAAALALLPASGEPASELANAVAISRAINRSQLGLTTASAVESAKKKGPNRNATSINNDKAESVTQDGQAFALATIVRELRVLAMMLAAPGIGYCSTTNLALSAISRFEADAREQERTVLSTHQDVEELLGPIWMQHVGASFSSSIESIKARLLMESLDEFPVLAKLMS